MRRGWPDKYKRLTAHVTIVLVAVLTMLSRSVLAFGSEVGVSSSLPNFEQFLGRKYKKRTTGR